MADDKDYRSPSKVWSPHGAALHRRRTVGEKTKDSVLGCLGKMDLSDDDDDLFVKTSAKNSPSKKISPTRKKGRNSIGSNMMRIQEAEVDRELRQSLEGVSPSVRAKLKKVLDKATPMKERLELEVKMMKIPDERKILADFKYKFERKDLNMKIFESEMKQQEHLEGLLGEEAVRAKAEQEEFAKKREEKIKEEMAKKEREAKVERDVKLHKVKTIAHDAEELRLEAEKTTEAAARNKAKKERLAREQEQRISDFINGEGKHLTHVERELRIARMLNDGSL